MSASRGITPILLGVMMALVVSGADVTSVQGVSGTNVLLPCNCSGRNLGFKWQMVGKKPFFTHNGSPQEPVFSDGYKDRVELLQSKDNRNCSILLKKVTVNDTGEYKCIFWIEERYNYDSVNLSVSAETGSLSRLSVTLAPAPPRAPGNTRILVLVMPFVLFGLVLSLFLFRTWNVSRKLSQDNKTDTELQVMSNC